jgi:hypothetical protein
MPEVRRVIHRRVNMAQKYYDFFTNLHLEYVEAHNKEPEQARLSQKTLLSLMSELRPATDFLGGRKTDGRGIRLRGIRLVVDPALPDEEIIFEGMA